MRRLNPGMVLALALLAAGTPALAHEQHGPAAPTAGDPDCFKAERDWFTDTELVTQAGRPVRFFSDVLRDRVVMVNFMFTQCKDACPLLTDRMIRAADEYTRLTGKKVSLVSLSVDPVHDTPEALTVFAAKFGPVADWTLLTGDPARMAEIARRLGQVFRDPTDHTTLMPAGHVNARRWAKVPPTDSIEMVAQRLALLTAPPAPGAQRVSAACAG
jgi:protein SCO1/2